MSEGFHAKLSIFVWRKSTSALSYLGERGADAHHLALRAVGVYEDFLGALCGLEGPSQLLGVKCFLNSPLLDDCELLRGDSLRDELAVLDIALIGALEGGATSDDPTWAWHLDLEVGVVGDGHELHVARVS
jgi:hypothetical protein